jgi:glucose-6-phosphate isomerase, archaeal
MEIRAPRNWTEWSTGAVRGEGVVTATRVIGDLGGVYADEAARAAMDQDQPVYRTECLFPVPEGTEGGLFWGTTIIQAGDVGGEYFMTKGHVHAKADRMESYFTYAGSGLLLMMDADRTCWAEEMLPGSTHLIPGHTAHRTINVGDDVFSFGACWPSDAGHDYDAIARNGFPFRVVRGATGLQVMAA